MLHKIIANIVIGRNDLPVVGKFFENFHFSQFFVFYSQNCRALTLSLSLEKFCILKTKLFYLSRLKQMSAYYHPCRRNGFQLWVIQLGPKFRNFSVDRWRQHEDSAFYCLNVDRSYCSHSNESEKIFNLLSLFSLRLIEISPTTFLRIWTMPFWTNKTELLSWVFSQTICWGAVYSGLKDLFFTSTMKI